MDKHERPYKCDAPGCEKLQGFTYSGGLLRHQREVHKMHGGTKEALFCPFGNCKRATGAGFTRKENRDEHIRRVHRRATEAVDGSNAAGKRDREAMEEADALLQDISHIDVIEAVEAVEPIITAPVSKRRRVTQATMISRSNGNSNGPSHGIGNAMNHALANAAIDPALESSDSDLKSSIKSLQEANHILVKQNESIRRDCLNLTERLNRLEELLGRNGVPESMLR
jgi:DNA repair ATPase RecN